MVVDAALVRMDDTIHTLERMIFHMPEVADVNLDNTMVVVGLDDTMVAVAVVALFLVVGTSYYQHSEAADLGIDLRTPWAEKTETWSFLMKKSS
jgi:hypothetical protein